MEENQNKNEQNKYKGGAYNSKEAELIKKFVELRKEQKEQLPIVDLSEYQLPPRTQFSMLKKPAVSFKYPECTFNMASIRLFEGIQHILPFTSSKYKSVVVVMCTEEEKDSLEWCRIQKKDGQLVNKPIKSIEYIDNIYNFMQWDKSCRYKALGTIVRSNNHGLCLSFDLDDAIMVDPKVREFVDEETGEVTKKKIIYYPNKYKGQVGKSYDDYVASKQRNVFESFDGMIGHTYDDYQNNDDQNKQQENEGQNNEWN